MRYLVVLVLGLALGWSQPLLAQQVAIFDYDDRGTNPDALGRHIESGLKEMFPAIGVDHYCGQGDEARSIKILSAIEQKRYGLVIIRTSNALIMAQHTLFQTPTLYTNANNPLILGFKTLGPPGGNISGASYYIPIKTHLAVYQAIQPALRRPGFIFDQNNQSRKAEVPEAREACSSLGLAFDMEFVQDRSELRRAVQTLLDRGVDALIAASSGTIYENIDTFVDLATQAGVPVFSFYKTGVGRGAVAAVSSDFFRLADELLLPMAGRVLRDGISPGAMPAAFLKRNKLFVNRALVSKLGLALPEELVAAYEVVNVEGLR